MSATKFINHRIVIPVISHRWFSRKDARGEHRLFQDHCADLAPAILAVVNLTAGNHGHPYMQSDEVCAFCESKWEWSRGDCPECCQKAIDLWESESQHEQAKP